MRERRGARYEKNLKKKLLSTSRKNIGGQKRVGLSFEGKGKNYC